MAKAKKDEFTITIDGVTHTVDFDDFESWEIEFVEDLMDAPLVEIDFRRWKAIRALVYVFRHRDDPKVTFADLESMKPTDLGGEGNGDGPPTKPAAKKRAASTRAASGGQS